LSSIKPNLRLRIFAGPNGSGKSTIIRAVRDYKVKEIPVDFGTYINADDIAQTLLQKHLSFSKYHTSVNKNTFIEEVKKSGLINERFPEKKFIESFSIKDNNLRLLNTESNELLAQVIADFLRKKLLENKKKFSFETVFSHPSKLDIMKAASLAGYKVYLYFVSTESPEINKYRVKVRTQQNGHDVPESLIESRYYRSLDLLYDAAQLAYQMYFFDNSREGENFRLFAHFKLNKEGKKDWDDIDESSLPNWFIKYYLNKIPK
jgi:predicted ABC-type ATPase